MALNHKGLVAEKVFPRKVTLYIVKVQNKNYAKYKSDYIFEISIKSL